MLESLKNKKIMVVVAHPDDEVLGLGSTINRIINDYNSKVHLIILGEGITSRFDKKDIISSKKYLKTHKKNIESARKKIDINLFQLMGFQIINLILLHFWI